MPADLMDFSWLLNPEGLTAHGVIVVDALAPLSMVAGQAGAYYRSQPAPTDGMLYGMLENALGWHFETEMRKAILKEIRKAGKRGPGRPGWLEEADTGSGSGFISLLQHHLRFTLGVLPHVTHYDDLWSQQLHDTASSRFFGGSRSYDYRVGRFVTAARRGSLTFGDRAEHNVRTWEDLELAEAGAKVHFKAVRERFPQYYVTPTPREYVVPDGPYQYRVVATPTVAERVKAALDDPVAPLYLGSNDGWVEARWEDLG